MDQRNEEHMIIRRRPRAVVWDFFERVTGDDGLPKTKCNKCNVVYSNSPSSGTSTMRRHLRKCYPQPLTQFNPIEPAILTKTARSSDELNEDRAAKKLKSVMVDNLQTKTDRELLEFVWRNKRNIALLEEKLPEKAISVKEALKCYEDELERRAKLKSHKESTPGPCTSIVAVKTEINDQPVTRNKNFHESMAEDGCAVEGKNRETHADANQQQNSPQLDSEEVVVKVEVDDQSVAGNENSNGKIAEEGSAGRLQIVAINGDENQASAQQTDISVSPEDIRAELRKVSSALSVLTSPTGFYTPQANPLDEEAEQAKQQLEQLLKKDLETIVGSPDELNVKASIQILIKNLEKLPRFQGRVIESLASEFETACENWITWHENVQMNLGFEAQHKENLEFLQEWQKTDVEIEHRIGVVDADIRRLKAELRVKEMCRERLVKQKWEVFDKSRMSIEEAKGLLQEMVGVKVQSEVAIGNMKDLATKWERMRGNFQGKYP